MAKCKPLLILNREGNIETCQEIFLNQSTQIQPDVVKHSAVSFTSPHSCNKFSVIFVLTFCWMVDVFLLFHLPFESSEGKICVLLLQGTDKLL